MKKQIIFLELNEVPDLLLDRYAQSSSSFSAVLSKFSRYQTYCHDRIHLSPWITWPTVHRGVGYENHRIDNLGQDVTEADLHFSPIWKDLKKAGFDVGVYGSLHTSALPSDYTNYSFYVPEPFSDHSTCHPSDLIPFQDFQLNLSRRSARNVDGSLPTKQRKKLILSLFSLGLKPRTILMLLKQLILEKLIKPRLTRRRILQSALNFDIYCKLLESNSPDFSTFFTNHVASAMHRYWEASFPSDYGELSQSQEWRQVFRSEITKAMNLTEYMITSLMKFADQSPSRELWVCSSMGQSPVQGYDSIKFQLILSHPIKLLEFLGLQPSLYSIKPTMAPRVTYSSEDQSALDLFSDRLEVMTINGLKIEKMSHPGTLSLRIMHWNTDPEVVYMGNSFDLKKAGFEMVPIDDSSGTSAYHVPEGILLIYGKDSSRFVTKSPIPTTKIYSMIKDSVVSM